MKLQVTVNFEFIYENFDFDKANRQEKQGFVLEGGSGSAKSWDIIQFLIYYCQINENKGKDILIFRLTYADLKKTILKDFIKILKRYGIYRLEHHTKSQPQHYTLYGNVIYFSGLDGMGSHGERHDIIWGNEGMELYAEDFKQLNQRCNEAFFIDYNPSCTEHWIFDILITRPDTFFFKSTQLDNPFLPEGQRKEILSYEPTPENIENGTADEYMWKVYGLGERSARKGAVFPEWGIKEYPKDSEPLGLWLDYGYTNHPSACGVMTKHQGALYVKEYFYETGLTNIINLNNTDRPSIEKRFKEFGVSKDIMIFADKAEPKSIAELRDSGYNIYKAPKFPGSVNKGIEILKKWKLFIDPGSKNIIDERNNYKWIENKSISQMEFTNKPLDAWNHHIDGIRGVALYFNRVGSL